MELVGFSQLSLRQTPWSSSLPHMPFKESICLSILSGPFHQPTLPEESLSCIAFFQ